jgi:hypothetical protein
MSGSGQSNMLDLINANEARLRELRRTPHTFYNDPGHAWLGVKYQDLIILDLVGSISRYSYRKGDDVYLEEDLDAGIYIRALWGDKITSPEFQQWKSMLKEFHREDIFIRNLNQYK